MGKSKFYVVWAGRQRGIFETWEQCKAQIFEFPNAAYKSFETKALAEQAFTSSKAGFVGKRHHKTESASKHLNVFGKPIEESISVDGAWNTATGVAEYQGVYTKTKAPIFKMGPFDDGTNNIVEFLAIVHALAYCKQNNIKLPIYSDSHTAIVWVRNKVAKTNHERNNKNKELFELVDRAISWLNTNEYETKILKWETKAWGENPADFGRK